MSTHLLGSRRTDWLGPLKGIAILWVFLNHHAERIFGYPLISNPTDGWPPFADRLEQLGPVEFGSPASDVVLNFARYLGWAGDQGVQLFLICSGFGLMWSALQRNDVESYRGFLRRRILRIFPLWWGAHLCFIVLSVFVGSYGMRPLDPRFYLSMIGFRATKDTIYYFSPAWWYVGLILQLYLVFPLLARWLRKVGPARFLVCVLGVSLTVRLIGLYVFDSYLDAWSRGAVFVTRLPEFACGMALAFWMCKFPAATDRGLRCRWVVAGAVALYIAATGLALTLWGMAVAPLLHGVAAFVLLYATTFWTRTHLSPVISVLAWFGGISYSLYLTHHPIAAFLVDSAATPGVAAIARALPVLGVAVVAALLLERTVDWVEARLVEQTRRHGGRSIVARLIATTAVAAALLLGAEATVRHLNPQEAHGWGERPSLQPHPAYGWTLIPGSTTRLRWETYDYVVHANELGFPGPLYPENRTPGTLRIMTLGDAFTSAEGVDTDQSWPRVLETVLNERKVGTRVEVLNFAVTGYGPNQNAAVFREFGPRFRPDVVLIGFFVNEFSDALISNEEFQSAIGFGLPAQSGWRTYFELAQVRSLLQHRVTDPIREFVAGAPSGYGYFLGYFRAFETEQRDELREGAERVRQRLAEIKSTADHIGAEVIVLLIPAAIQVCEPKDLTYFPSTIDLGDHEKFDLDRPQVVAREIAGELNIATYDLRDPLRSLEECPYQPWNMHWLPKGHNAVASLVADVLSRDAGAQGPLAPEMTSR